MSQEIGSCLHYADIAVYFPYAQRIWEVYSKSGETKCMCVHGLTAHEVYSMKDLPTKVVKSIRLRILRFKVVQEEVL